jgi:hypothetical protein
VCATFSGLGGGGRRLVVDDLALLDQIKDTYQLRKTMVDQIRFNWDFNSIGFRGVFEPRLPQVDFTKTPGGELFVFFVSLPVHRFFLVLGIPRLGELIVESFEREWCLHPSSLVPCFQSGVNHIADM